MKRIICVTLAVVILCTSALLVFLRFYQPPLPPPHSGLLRVPLSAYKYDLCAEAFAYAYASSDNPFKTDYDFPDPFRHTTDTIIPHLLGCDPASRTVTFSIDAIVGHLATFHISINHIHELDGIEIVLPDAHNRAIYTSIPQFNEVVEDQKLGMVFGLIIHEERALTLFIFLNLGIGFKSTFLPSSSIKIA